MTTARLAFVASPEDAGPPDDGTIHVVLDSAWTPGPGDRDDVVPVRPAISRVLERVDLFSESLDRLDDWAARSGIAETLTLDGVSWWYRHRPDLHAFLLERLAWVHVIRDLAERAPIDHVDVPRRDRVVCDAVAAVAASAGWTWSAVDPTTAPAPAPSAGHGRSTSRMARLRRAPGWPRRFFRARQDARRAALLADRLVELAATPGAVLYISQVHLRHAIESSTGDRRQDAFLAPVIERGRSMGIRSIVLDLEADHQRDDHWAAVVEDPDYLPESAIRRPPSPAPSLEADGGIAGALVTARGAPLEVEGADLATAVVEQIARLTRGWPTPQRAGDATAGELLERLRPSAVVLSHERIRTSWIAAARRRSIPVVAVQHGVIHALHLDYRYPLPPGLERPSVTCVCGEYERTVLRELGGFRDDEVVATGSPRAGGPDDPGAGAARLAARTTVRRELGVAADHRLLVVSTAPGAVFRRYYGADFMARYLAAPLPGTHVLLKLHPRELDEGPYLRLLRGVGRDPSEPSSPITVVRDLDVYRLLRAADAHLGLHSTVLTDAVLAGTPNLLATCHAYRDPIGYVAAGVATPVRDAADLARALEHLPEPDPGARAAFLARHFREGDAPSRVVGVISALVERARGGTAEIDRT